ncbi:MAG: four helix bundle protein [Moheibacter sp.]
MSFKFEKLIIWQESMKFRELIFQISKKFPEAEKFNLTSQIRRAADSIALNIAEGSILQSKLEFRRFLGYSIGSTAEVVTCLYKAKERNYIDETEFKSAYEFSYKLMNTIISFRKNVE